MVPGYKGVTIKIPQAISHQNFYYSLDEKYKGTYEDLNGLYKELFDRFKEAVSANRGPLPSCLRVKLGNYFAELAAGTKSLSITWQPGVSD